MGKSFGGAGDGRSTRIEPGRSPEVTGLSEISNERGDALDHESRVDEVPSEAAELVDLSLVSFGRSCCGQVSEVLVEHLLHPDVALLAGVVVEEKRLDRLTPDGRRLVGAPCMCLHERVPSSFPSAGREVVVGEQAVCTPVGPCTVEELGKHPQVQIRAFEGGADEQPS